MMSKLTNSSTVSTQGSNRGQQLVDAASRVIHERGAAATTLAIVASEASVPLGNVYYYFKTKDDLVAAVVASRLEELRAFLAFADRMPTPVERLRLVVEGFASRAQDIVERGCAYGMLASELAKRDGRDARDDAPLEGVDAAGADGHAAALFSLQLTWMEAQFRTLEVRAPKGRAVELLCAIQGACLLAHTLHDASIFERRLSELSRDLVRPDVPATKRMKRHSR
jgi:TetR/AcrR family transcriptional repressor of nem operon